MKALPSEVEMLQAFLASDSAAEGIFIVAVKTTGIFCRPTCPARKPLPRNVVFFGNTDEAAPRWVSSLQTVHSTR